MNNQFKIKRYDYCIIIESLRLYYHFEVSYRVYSKIMHKFSKYVHHITIYEQTI